MAPAFIYLLVVTQALLTAVLISAVVSSGMLIVVFFTNPRRTREEDFDLTARFLPWPKWMPGWVDSKTLSVEEHVRRSGKNKSRSTAKGQKPKGQKPKGQKPKGQKPKGQNSNRQMPQDSNVGKRGRSPNPVQRMLVDRPGFTPFIQSLFLVGPLNFVSRQGRPLLALQLYLGGFAVLVVLYWVRPARKMSRAERWNAEGVIFPWPKGWPGWRDPKALAMENS